MAKYDPNPGVPYCSWFPSKVTLSRTPARRASEASNSFLFFWQASPFASAGGRILHRGASVFFPRRQREAAERQRVDSFWFLARPLGQAFFFFFWLSRGPPFLRHILCFWLGEAGALIWSSGQIVVKLPLKGTPPGSLKGAVQMLNPYPRSRTMASSNTPLRADWPSDVRVASFSSWFWSGLKPKSTAPKKSQRSAPLILRESPTPKSLLSLLL